MNGFQHPKNETLQLKVLSEEEKEEWLRLGKVLSTSPMAISNSEHVVYVARKI